MKRPKQKETLTAKYLLELLPSQKERWQVAAKESGARSFGQWIRDGIELVERAQEAPGESALELVRQMVERTRGAKRKAWQAAEKAIMVASDKGN